MGTRVDVARRTFVLRAHLGVVGSTEGDADAAGTGTVMAAAAKMLLLMLLGKTARLLSLILYH